MTTASIPIVDHPQFHRKDQLKKKRSLYLWEIAAVTNKGDSIIVYYTDEDWNSIIQFCSILYEAEYKDQTCAAVWVLGNPENAPTDLQDKFEGEQLSLRYVYSRAKK